MTLIDVPWALGVASQQHRHAILRELVIAADDIALLAVRPTPPHRG